MTVVGRREDADFRIPLTDVSRKHCRLIKDGAALRLEDLGSSNGTLHNGNKVKACALSAGDTIRIGPVSFVVQIDGTPAEHDAELPRPARTASPTGGPAGGSYAPPPERPSFDGSSTFDLAADATAADEA